MKIMKEIKTTNIIGMGALGLLYADMIQTNLGSHAVSFLLDDSRYEKYKNQTFTINGEEKRFNMISEKDAVPVDFVIVSVKYNGLEAALKTMEKVVGPETVIISVMNGISSEEIIASKFGGGKVIYSVAQAMDAMKSGSSMVYTKAGELRIGYARGGTKENLELVKDFFNRAGIAYTEEQDIIRRLWNKFMCNVGINQTCMVYGKCYREVLAPGKANDTFIGAMREVILLSKAEGINLTEEDLEGWVKIISSLAPEGTPSMGQDRIARRKSEVELFSGTMLRLAEKHNLVLPVNKWLYEQVQKIEAEY